MMCIEKQANVRYNMQVFNEIIEVFRKKISFRILSLNIRERVASDGKFEETKIKRLVSQTGIEEACFTGEKRFFIPKNEVEISKNPKILCESHLTQSVPNFLQNINIIIESCERKELVEDENLERLIHFIKNNESIKGYYREQCSIRILNVLLDRLPNNAIFETEISQLKTFLKLSKEKIVLAEAAVIMNKDTKNNV